MEDATSFFGSTREKNDALGFQNLHFSTIDYRSLQICRLFSQAINKNTAESLRFYTLFSSIQKTPPAGCYFSPWVRFSARKNIVVESRHSCVHQPFCCLAAHSKVLLVKRRHSCWLQAIFFLPFWKFPRRSWGGKWTSKRKTFICFLGVGCDCVAWAFVNTKGMMNERINTGSLHCKGGYVYNIYIVNHSCACLLRGSTVHFPNPWLKFSTTKIIQASSVPQFEASAIFAPRLKKRWTFLAQSSMDEPLLCWDVLLVLDVNRLIFTPI